MKRKWFIGIDISKLTLDLVIYDPMTQKAAKHLKTSNDSKGFKSILHLIRDEGLNAQEVFICMEYCGIYGLELGLFLEGKIDFSFCSPLHIKRSLGLTRGKNDKIDALKIARFAYLFRDELISTIMPSELMIKLKMLLAERLRVVKAATVEKQIISEFSNNLERQASFRAQRRLKQLSEDIKSIEKEMYELLSESTELKKNYDLLTSIVGIGMINAIMMILYTNNFDGITNARAFACYCGIAPFEYSSGTSIRGKTRVSHLANKKIKADLTNAARSAIVHDPELRIYYKRKRAEGKSHGTVINAVKFKIVTRAFAVINRGTPYVKMRNAG